MVLYVNDTIISNECYIGVIIYIPVATGQFFYIARSLDACMIKKKKFIFLIHLLLTRCQPSKGRRCIPEVVIWVHVETYLNDFFLALQHKSKFNFELF